MDRQGPLIAYVTAESSNVDPKNIRSRLAERLPAHMLPAAVMVLPLLPFTANGKLDRKARPSPEVSSTSSEWVSPSTPEEWQLSSLFGELLGIKQVGANDNFFELGGHSLLAIRLLSQIKEQLGCQLSIGTLFEAPTAAQAGETNPA